MVPTWFLLGSTLGHDKRFAKTPSTCAHSGLVPRWFQDGSAMKHATLCHSTPRIPQYSLLAHDVPAWFLRGSAAGYNSHVAKMPNAFTHSGLVPRRFRDGSKMKRAALCHSTPRIPQDTLLFHSVPTWFLFGSALPHATRFATTPNTDRYSNDDAPIFKTAQSAESETFPNFFSHTVSRCFDKRPSRFGAVSLPPQRAVFHTRRYDDLAM